MLHDKKEKAISLRKSGMSFSYIAKELVVSKGSLSRWLKGVVVEPSTLAAMQDRGRVRSLQTLQKHVQGRTQSAQERAALIREQARRECAAGAREPLLLLGAALYWAEGYKRVYAHSKSKTSHAISFANTDPGMIMIFLRFLKQVCGVPEHKIRMQILVHAGMDTEKVMEYWISITRLSAGHFTKTHVRRAKPSVKPFYQLPYGTAQVRVYDTALFHRILGWIDGLAEIGDIR